jgi:hypothetical protein
MIFGQELKWGLNVRRRGGKFTERPLGPDHPSQVSVSLLSAACCALARSVPTLFDPSSFEKSKVGFSCLVIKACLITIVIII